VGRIKNRPGGYLLFYPGVILLRLRNTTAASCIIFPGWRTPLKLHRFPAAFPGFNGIVFSCPTVLKPSIMNKKLQGKKVAILAADGFEQSELEKPMEVLLEEGATVSILSLKKGSIKGWNDKNWGDEFQVDAAINESNSGEYDALVLPGGVMNPDQLRTNGTAVAFVSDFIKAGKPVAAICHAPWTLIETGRLQGRTLTSYASVKTDLLNAGANWVDEEVVVDNGLVTSRSPKDLPAFCKKNGGRDCRGSAPALANILH
jgi:protease I